MFSNFFHKEAGQTVLSLALIHYGVENAIKFPFTYWWATDPEGHLCFSLPVHSVYSYPCRIGAVAQGGQHINHPVDSCVDTCSRQCLQITLSLYYSVKPSVWIQSEGCRHQLLLCCTFIKLWCCVSAADSRDAKPSSHCPSTALNKPPRTFTPSMSRTLCSCHCSLASIGCHPLYLETSARSRVKTSPALLFRE